MKTLAILLALTFPAAALATEPLPPPQHFTVSLSGDVKPLPWHMQNAVAGKVVAW